MQLPFPAGTETVRTRSCSDYYRFLICFGPSRTFDMFCLWMPFNLLLLGFVFWKMRYYLDSIDTSEMEHPLIGYHYWLVRRHLISINFSLFHLNSNSSELSTNTPIWNHIHFQPHMLIHQILHLLGIAANDTIKLLSVLQENDCRETTDRIGGWKSCSHHRRRDRNYLW